MNIQLEPGKYVIAISGGVDSVALLHMLKGFPNTELIVAHFDHGIREDSSADRMFVQKLADEYNLPFAYEEGRLGAKTSEAAARKARYDFLEKTRRTRGAEAIITAHHQDDVLETAIINLLRGTGRKGLSSLNSNENVVRPLLHVPKKDLTAYAKKHDLDWREDSTNEDQSYLRNYVRRQLLPQFDEPGKADLLTIISQSRKTNQELDTLLAKQLVTSENNLDRRWFNQLPHGVAREFMAAWLRANNIRDFDAKGLERLVVAAKISPPGRRFDVLGPVSMEVGKDNLALTHAER